jgi:hypothetical protein
MIWSMSNYKADLNRFMDRLEDRQLFLEQEERKRAEAYAKLREKTLKDLALPGINQDIPETPPEE